MNILDVLAFGHGRYHGESERFLIKVSESTGTVEQLHLSADWWVKSPEMELSHYCPSLHFLCSFTDHTHTALTTSQCVIMDTVLANYDGWMRRNGWVCIEVQKKPFRSVQGGNMHVYLCEMVWMKFMSALKWMFGMCTNAY